MACFNPKLTSGFAVNPLSNRRDNGGISHIKPFSYEPRSGTHRGFSPPALLRSHVLVGYSLREVGPMSGFHPYSSVMGGKKARSEGVGVSRASGVEVSVGGSVNDWVGKVKDVWEVMDYHLCVRDIVVPVAGTLTATLMAWVVFPWVLKRMHKYSTKGTSALLHGTLLDVEIPYEKTIWGAMEDPVRYLVTFLAFLEICYLVAPDAVAELMGQAWQGATVLSFVWFLQRWKTYLIDRAKNGQYLDGETLILLDRVTSVGLFIIAAMAIAEECGVAVQSFLTVGGIGGVATAFASKDILGNVLSGLSMQFLKPFSLGDTIKAGSVEGEVVEMGLTTTSLLNAEKFPVIVPNSTFSSQVIVNKSRGQWRAFVTQIHLKLQNLETIPVITDDIKTMLRSNPNVFTGREPPYCYLSRINSSYAELTLGGNLIHLSKEEQCSTEQDILLHCIQIIKQHGASLGSA